MKNMAGREAGYFGHTTRESTLTRSLSAYFIEHNWSSNISSIQEKNHTKKQTHLPLSSLTPCKGLVIFQAMYLTSLAPGGKAGAQLQPPESRKGIANLPLHSLTLLGVEPVCMASLRVFRTRLPWTDFPVCYFN